MAPRKKPQPLVAIVDEAVASMHWLTDADKAAAELARRYASEIDEAAASGDPAYRSKVTVWAGTHLLNTLKALGGTPAERKALAVDAPVKGRLRELRERTAG